VDRTIVVRAAKWTVGRDGHVVAETRPVLLWQFDNDARRSDVGAPPLRTTRARKS
jgi:hypothetical protein